MAISPFEHLHKRNARLVKFLDRCHNISSMIMRICIHLEEYCHDNFLVVENVTFETTSSPDGRYIHIRIK